MVENVLETLDIRELLTLLPHRYPFLLIDRVLELTDDRVLALKNCTINEPFFQGHFPGVPVMPGVLQIEALAKAEGVNIIVDREAVVWADKAVDLTQKLNAEMK